jgi:glycosyltransferase involved in cell wall biosynthesis
MKKRHNKTFEVIQNGFDEKTLGIDQSRPISKFNIVYTGAANLGKPNFRPLLDAIANLICSGKIDQNDISIEFYGAGNEKSLERMFSNHPFRKLVKNYGYLPRERMSDLQRSAAILLQATYPGTGTLTSKVYEYLVAFRPILAIPNDHGEIASLLQETITGLCCTSVGEISSQLFEWYVEWKNTGTIKCNCNEPAIMKYSRREQAGQLAQLLNRIVL